MFGYFICGKSFSNQTYSISGVMFIFSSKESGFESFRGSPKLRIMKELPVFASVPSVSFIYLQIFDPSKINVGINSDMWLQAAFFNIIY